MRTKKIGLDAKADRLLPQPCVTLEELNQTMVDKKVTESKNEEEEEQLVQKSQNEGGLENQNGIETEEAGKTNSLTQLQIPPQIVMDNVIESAIQVMCIAFTWKHSMLDSFVLKELGSSGFLRTWKFRECSRTCRFIAS